MLLLIDNYDSFTYNLVQYFGELGQETTVVRNDAITPDEVAALNPERIIISPGPCTPNEAGVSVAVVQELMGKMPILGVCLGHQCIGQALGGRIIRAQKVMHGKVSPIHHHGRDLFHEIASPFTATRYHSLVIDPDCLPKTLEITAWIDEKNDDSGGGIMAIRHKTLPLFGVQFHPESILTLKGHDILRNFLAL